MRAQPVTVVGAGLAGPLLAILLARRGFTVTVYERRRDPRTSAAEAGRSINLALAARGIRALERAGIMDRVRPLMIPMRGRMVHELGGSAALQPYGQRPGEVIYSVGRAALNRLLIEEAARLRRVTFRFEQSCLGLSGPGGRLALRDGRSGRGYEAPAGEASPDAAPLDDAPPDEAPPTPVIATDGAGSAVRASLVERESISAREDMLDHDYKELEVRTAALEPHALHVWPRHGFMLIALPNTDGTFTATLFLPREGPLSFASLAADRAVEELFGANFPDFVPLVPDLLRQFRDHPQGRLGTVHAEPWHLGGRALLLGDAAHAIVPFHGQGMNAAFEDCLALDALLERHEDWAALFAAFEAERRPNAEAIARMAIENYGEMRERVLDRKFLRQKALGVELERRFADRFIPRYSMVMFHPEISYAESLRRGAVQQEILDALDERSRAEGGLDWRLAEELVAARLAAR